MDEELTDKAGKVNNFSVDQFLQATGIFDMPPDSNFKEQQLQEVDAKT